MKKAFIITSILEVDNGFPLTYSATRSHFGTEERFRQTIFTIASLDALSKDETTIFLVDASDSYQFYRDTLMYQRNLVFVSVKEEFPHILKTLREHPNKSYCETLILLNFFDKYKTKLESYDYFFKFSGRYFTDSSFDQSLLNEDNVNQLFFKKPMTFDWIDGWNYQMVDRRELQGDNKLYQYCSVFYGWGRGYLGKMIDLYRGIALFTSHPNGIKYDVETLLYYFTREFEKDIIETSWRVYGWDGVNGTFLRY